MLNNSNGWIKIHRKFLNSSVFDNPILLKVWFWCLMKANHTTSKFPFNGADMEVKAGEFITGVKVACKELKLTQQKYRTCITYLQNTERISLKSTNRFTVISVNKWADYQTTNKPITNQQQTNNIPITTYKNDKNVKNEGNTTFNPPLLEEIKQYCITRKNRVNHEKFRDFYESKGWMIGKNKMKDWKAAIRTWEQSDKPLQETNQRIL